MNVVKIGGGVLTGPDPLRAIPALLEHFQRQCVLVVSAFGKTTNHLEQVVAGALGHDAGRASQGFDAIVDWHAALAATLGIHRQWARIREAAVQCREALTRARQLEPAALSDLVVSLGEQLSSQLVAAYLATAGIPSQWVDATRLVRTDRAYGRARPRLDLMRAGAASMLMPLFPRHVPVIAGFIGSAEDGSPTTLGREGSDYTAALIGWAIGAREVLLLKNVSGILSADPRLVPQARRIHALSFTQAERLFRAGAKVVHPKTIGPLRHARIPLRVAAFEDPDGGSLVGADFSWEEGAVHAVASRPLRSRADPAGRHSDDALITVLAEPPLAMPVVEKVDEALLAEHVVVRHRTPARGTWVSLVRGAAVARTLCSVHGLVHCQEEGR